MVLKAIEHDEENLVRKIPGADSLKIWALKIVQPVPNSAMPTWHLKLLAPAILGQLCVRNRLAKSSIRGPLNVNDPAETLKAGVPNVDCVKMVLAAVPKIPSGFVT